jgi:hypothetical protein
MVRVYWHDEHKTIIYQDFSGEWIAHHYYDIVNKTYRMIDTVDHPVSVILDFTASETSAAKVFSSISISSSGALSAQIHPNQRMIIVLGADQFLKTVFNMWERISPRMVENLHYADGILEALETISHHTSDD